MEELLGETIEYNNKRYIVVSTFGDDIWLFDEEIAITGKTNGEMFLIIKYNDLQQKENLEEDMEV